MVVSSNEVLGYHGLFTISGMDIEVMYKCLVSVAETQVTDGCIWQQPFHIPLLHDLTMGWFGGSKQPEKPDPASRTNRQRCWDSRDAYFACLDSVKVIRPGEEGDVCTTPKASYEQNCARSWVSTLNSLTNQVFVIMFRA